ncbi:hypothetical protein [Ferrigenium sp. UT5]|uniref:hypothetical protein n=1 Tax=Ferrigenium sp. UT5 TaxID=3242105 RepID=UPI003550177E
MVIGFVLSIIVMEVMGKFFFSTFALAMHDASTISNIFDLVGIVVAVGVFFTTSVMIVNLSVNLIHLIPDTALQWLGSHTQSSSAGNRAGENFTAVATGGTAAGRDIMGGAMQKSRQRRDGAARSEAEAKRHSEMLDAISGRANNATSAGARGAAVSGG